jgi:RNA-directed DNA polymerase
MPLANVTTQNDTTINWTAIEWQRQYHIVNNLRQRIYRAAELGHLKRVRNLQKLMLKATANKLIAIRRVTQQNQGRNSPGVDKVIVRTKAAREQLYQALCVIRASEASPVKRVYIPKKKGMRPLGLPTIFDRCMQAIVKNALEPYWEAQFESTSYGFRPGRSAHDAIEKIFCVANSKNTRKWVLDADIQGAFDHINHKFLLNRIKGFPGIVWIKQWLMAGVMENQLWSPTLTGTPQGGIISPLLANIALHGMESALAIQVDRRGYLRSGCCALVRYADDFVVFHETREGCEMAQSQLQSWLAQRGLKLSVDKTQIRHLTQGFDFLGFHIRHYPVKNRKLPYIFLAKPAKSSIKHFRHLIRQAFKRAQAWPIQQVIDLLNPLVRGWGYYFRIGSATKSFASLDQWMWVRQQRFVARRHPNKNWRWRRAQYWGVIPGRRDQWVFSDKKSDKHLAKLAWTPIKRHVLIKGNASPDNPALRAYWQARKKQLRHRIGTQQVSKLLEPNAG